MNLRNGSLTVPTNINAGGTLFAQEKSFDIKHQTEADKRLIYGVLEGPEHAVFYRGRIQSDVIELPVEWEWLVDINSITVQLTPIGQYQVIYVKNIQDNRVYLQSEDHIDCFFFVQGTRKDIPQLQIIK